VKALFVGPILSEFGWELMELQGYVRKQAEGFERVLVWTRPGREFLYAGIATMVYTHDIKCVSTDHRAHVIHNPDGHDATIESIDEQKAYLKKRGYEIIDCEIPSPDLRFREQFADHGLQSFAKLGRRQPRIVVHMRNKKHVDNSERNYPPELWERIIDGLRHRGPIAAIGTTAEALCLDRCEDYRDIAGEALCDLLANADIVIGPSSGPMHLASLCNAPHVTWTDKASTKRRYIDGWNPHRTPCAVLMQPKKDFLSPDAILAAVGCMMDPEARRRGIVYVCAGDEWPAILECSLKTLRMFSTLPVTVLACCESAKLCEVATAYDAEIIVPDMPSGTSQTKSRWMKTQLATLSPYDETLYLDCDTVVMGSLDNIWQHLTPETNLAMKTETPCPTIGQRDWVNNPPERGDTIGLCGASWPHYHSSTILFRKCPEVLALFRVWHREWARWGIDPRAPRIQDQPALARATYLTGVRAGTLPTIYNARYDPKGGDELTPETVVYSSSVYRKEFGQQWQRLYREAKRRSGKTEPDAYIMPEKPRKRILAGGNIRVLASVK
jgi:hypothetical protein